MVARRDEHLGDDQWVDTVCTYGCRGRHVQRSWTHKRRLQAGKGEDVPGKQVAATLLASNSLCNTYFKH